MSGTGLAKTKSQVGHNSSRWCIYSGNLRDAKANEFSLRGSIRSSANNVAEVASPHNGQGRSDMTTFPKSGEAAAAVGWDSVPTKASRDGVPTDDTRAKQIAYLAQRFDSN